MKISLTRLFTISITCLGLGIILGQKITDEAINLPKIKQEYVAIFEGFYFANCVQSNISRNHCLKQATSMSGEMTKEIEKDPYATSLPVPNMKTQTTHLNDIFPQDLNELKDPLFKI